MENTGLWVTIIIVLFVLGSIFNLRTSPRDKALAQLRENARKMGLNPRLVAAPDWLKLEKNGQYAPMIAYYHVMIADGKLPLMRALIEQQQLKVVMGDARYQHMTINLNGLYGIEMQANTVAVYWDESADLHGNYLVDLKAFLQQLADA
ncbi:ammonium transporter [Moraxella sp. ZY210820]|uniref:ammonium transporter n=1 Tax=unclassified Moraxella TaxID=2685852 RepID=UPI002731C099|nr:ammonium transporter [Moraxella sp. ZY210820]WLF83829.1 ammonium transporter [Moraxella sp. ZY210820]